MGAKEARKCHRFGAILDIAEWHFKNFPVSGHKEEDEATDKWRDSMCALSGTVYGFLDDAYEEGYADANRKKQ